MEWQTIETAPRDGTEILLLAPLEWSQQARDNEEQRIGLGNWIFAGWWWAEKKTWRNRLASWTNAPTHWLPLPPAPTTNQGSNHVNAQPRMG